MDNFGFVIHPVDAKKDVSRRFPLLGKVLPVPAIHVLLRFFPPLYISHITGCHSTSTGAVEFGFDFGFPSGRAYGCVAETMILVLEGRYESFSLGQGY
jgi:hypothetical protein